LEVTRLRLAGWTMSQEDLLIYLAHKNRSPT
jgi:hypothetical protein